MAYRSPLTEKAARLDAEGDIEKALMALAKAAGEGDLQARTQLGKRMLLGDRAPRMLKDGAAHILMAAQEAHPEAVAAMAILQCLGIQQRKNWQDALNTLTYAATLGWQQARQALLLLSHEPVLGEEQELLAIEEVAFWQQLGSNIDINRWLKIPQGKVLSDSPLLVSFEDFVPDRWRNLLANGAIPRLQRAHHADPAMMRNPNAETSNYWLSPIGLAENDFLHLLLQERMSKACGIAQTQMEGLAVLMYQEGDEFSEHVDYFDQESALGKAEVSELGQRILTFMVYLNDDYEGGETVFPELGITHKGKAGEGIYFVTARDSGEGDPRTRHAGLPVGSGNKWVLSQYFRSKPLGFLVDQ
ncbi:MAG TPA: 2OG-Fe(II) oxygenase [Pseudomonadaceae bacterium]|nr:2OG-Fe(II) oxygenase [Pseudomonadaceae bacterium]